MTRTKLTVALIVVVLAFYLLLLGFKGVALIAAGSPVAVALGMAILVLPLVGALLVWRELRFGQQAARLASTLDREGGLPLDDLPRRPSGRVDRGAAEEDFTARRLDAEASPEDWRVWFRLGMAYDAAGDRTRARAAVRRAIEMHGADQAASEEG